MKHLTLLLCCLLAGCSSAHVVTEKPDATPLPPASQQESPLPKPAPTPPATEGASPPDPTRKPAPAQLPQKPAVRYVLDAKTFLIKNPQQPKEKVLLLTFDDGPVGEATMRLLDILDRHHAKSIWFINGHQVAHKRPDGSYSLLPEKADLLRDIHKRGHLIGNHTWWHENLRKLPADKQREEIVSTSNLIADVLGEKPKYFRPPFGAHTPVSADICRELGMVSVNWSVGSLDWEPSVYKKSNGVTQQVLRTVHPGGNILFHDRIWTANELDAILTNLEKSGYQFVLPTAE